MTSVTPIYRRAPYAAIDPTAAANSQAGRTVLITGGNTGIGFAIAKAFIKASAATVIIVNRREEVLIKAVKELEKFATKSKVLGRVCDIVDQAQTEKFWKGLQNEAISVDILVLNAAAHGAGVLAKGSAVTLKPFELNVSGNLRMVESFLGQDSKLGKVVLNVSSGAAHGNPYHDGGYAASKAAFASLLQHLIEERPIEEVKVLNIHPGAVFTEAAEKAGYTAETLPWDDADLPGGFLVWAATPQADFLNGRFVWANWDVDGLLALKEKIEADFGFLKIGLQGVSNVDFAKVFEEIKKMGK